MRKRVNTGRNIVRMKGSALRSCAEFAKREHGAAFAERVTVGLTPSGDFLAATWYPIDVASALFTRLADEWGPDRAAIDERFRAMGRYVADDNLNTIYRVVLAILRPDNLVARLPSLWTTYFEGVDPDSEEQEPGRAYTRARGLDGLPFLAPAAAGWIEMAFLRAGARACNVRERNWDAGRNAAHQLWFEVQWSV
jgi:hypothetical protein